MTRSDVGIVGIIYATCLLFFYLTLQLRAAAQIYPMCLIAGLAILNTLYLAKCLLKLLKAHQTKVSSGLINDLPQVFGGFQARQFIFVVSACIAYMFLLHWLGFYLAGGIYLAGVMFFLRVKPAHMAMTTLFLGALIYGVFTIFLKVPLPKGILFN